MEEGTCEQMSVASGRHFTRSKGKETSSCSYWLCCCCHILPTESSWENHMPSSCRIRVRKCVKAGQSELEVRKHLQTVWFLQLACSSSRCPHRQHGAPIEHTGLMQLTADKSPPERSPGSRRNAVSSSPRSRRRSSRVTSSVARSQRREASLLWWREQGAQKAGLQLPIPRCRGVEGGYENADARLSKKKSHFDDLFLMDITT